MIHYLCCNWSKAFNYLREVFVNQKSSRFLQSTMQDHLSCNRALLMFAGYLSRWMCTATHKAGDTLSSRHVTSRDVTRAVGIFNIEFWRTLTHLSLCLRHVIWRGAVVGTHASTPQDSMLNIPTALVTSRELTWREASVSPALVCWCERRTPHRDGHGEKRESNRDRR
jgi:hypothetical protein